MYMLCLLCDWSTLLLYPDWKSEVSGEQQRLSLHQEGTCACILVINLPPFFEWTNWLKRQCYTCTRGETNKWRQASSKRMTRAAMQNHHMPCIYAYIHRAWLTGVWGGHINLAREKYHNSQEYIHFIFLAVMVVLSCKYSRKRCIFRDCGSVSQSVEIVYRILCPKYRWRPE